MNGKNSLLNASLDSVALFLVFGVVEWWWICLTVFGFVS
jgi:hypothetical protein